MAKKQRSEDQISPSQRAKLIQLWLAGYDLADISDRFGISIDSTALVLKTALSAERARRRAAETIEQRYKAWLTGNGPIIKGHSGKSA